MGEGQEQASLRRSERVSGSSEAREAAYLRLEEAHHLLAGGMEVSLLQEDWEEASQPPVVEGKASQLAWACWRPPVSVPAVEVTHC